MLIHSLLDAGLSFREVAKIAKCSHGSVSASKREWLAKKATAEKLKFEELIKNLGQNTVTDAVEQMKSMNLDNQVVQKVQDRLENDAREKVRAIQGVEAYETYD